MPGTDAPRHEPAQTLVSAPILVLSFEQAQATLGRFVFGDLRG